MTTTPHWKKSSYSQGGNNECVELNLGVTHARVRDSKAPETGDLRLPSGAFRSFVASLKST